MEVLDDLLSLFYDVTDIAPAAQTPPPGEC